MASPPPSTSPSVSRKSKQDKDTSPTTSPRTPSKRSPSTPSVPPLSMALTPLPEDQVSTEVGPPPSSSSSGPLLSPRSGSSKKRRSGGRSKLRTSGGESGGEEESPSSDTVSTSTPSSSPSSGLVTVTPSKSSSHRPKLSRRVSSTHSDTGTSSSSRKSGKGGSSGSSVLPPPSDDSDSSSPSPSHISDIPLAAAVLQQQHQHHKLRRAGSAVIGSTTASSTAMASPQGSPSVESRGTQSMQAPLRSPRSPRQKESPFAAYSSQVLPPADPLAEDEQDGSAAATDSSGLPSVVQMASFVERELLLQSPQLYSERLFLSEGGQAPSNSAAPSPSSEVSPSSRVITHGSVGGLISLLANPQAFQDKSFLDSFILSYEYFMDSLSLLKRLMHLYLQPPLAAEEQQQQQQQSQQQQQQRLFFQMRVINVLKKVIEMRYYALRRDRKCYQLLAKFLRLLARCGDEREKALVLHLRQAMKQNADIARSDASEAASASASSSAAAAAAAAGTSAAVASTAANASAASSSPSSSFASSSSSSPSSSHPAGLAAGGLGDGAAVSSPASFLGGGGGGLAPLGSGGLQKTLLDYSAKDLAAHLTLIDYELWSSIQLEEFYHAAFASKDKDRLTPFINRYIKRFNDVSAWVASTVVLAPKKKQRVAVLTRLIQIMDELRRMRNFNGMMAFYSALSLGAIQRLKKTWKEVSSKVSALWTSASKFMDSSAGYKTYKEFLKLADPPSIPYMGFILSDLVYAEEFPTWVAKDGRVDEDADSADESSSSAAAAGASEEEEENRSASAGSEDEADGDGRRKKKKKTSTSNNPSSGSSQKKQQHIHTHHRAGSKRSKSSAHPSTDASNTHGRSGANKYVNWVKMQLLAHSFGDILRFQRTRFPITENREIADFVGDLSRHSWFLSDAELNEMSRNIEPDNSSDGTVHTMPFSDGSSTGGGVLYTPSGSTSSPATPQKDKSKDKDKEKHKDKDRSSSSLSSNTSSGPGSDKMSRRGGKSPKNNATPPLWEDLVRDPAVFQEFKKFLEGRFNSESLLFWEAVQKFKTTVDFNDTAEVKRRADDILHKFVTGHAEHGHFMVGLNSSVTRDVKRQVDKGDIAPILFDRAVDEVEHVTLRPAFGDWLKTLGF